MVPNLFGSLAYSSVALDAFLSLSLSKAESHGRLSARQREILSLTVAQESECRYCLTAHTALAKSAGVSEAEAMREHTADNEDPFERASLVCGEHRPSAWSCFGQGLRERERPELMTADDGGRCQCRRE